MLTLFRVATFEDWTDVMYETMAVYPLSWIYYLTFIFVIAFIFPEHDDRHRAGDAAEGA
jgi:voltage-gated sodium channel